MWLFQEALNTWRWFFTTFKKLDISKTDSNLICASPKMKQVCTSGCLQWPTNCLQWVGECIWRSKVSIKGVSNSWFEPWLSMNKRRQSQFIRVLYWSRARIRASRFGLSYGQSGSGRFAEKSSRNWDRKFDDLRMICGPPWRRHNAVLSLYFLWQQHNTTYLPAPLTTAISIQKLSFWL